MLTPDISPTKVVFDDATFSVSLADGREIKVPLAWFPRLSGATKEELQEVTLSPLGIHWENLNEDISIKGLLAGKGDLTHKKGKVA